MAALKLWGHIALVALFTAIILTFIIRTTEMSRQQLPAALFSLSIILFQTHYGTISFIRVFALILLWLCWRSHLKHQRSRLTVILSILALGTLTWSYSATGHGADQGDFSLQQWVDWLHILASSIWVGSILIFTITVPAAKSTFPVYGIMAMRLSRLATVALLTILGSGTVNIVYQVEKITALWTSVYGKLLLVKLTLVISMIMLAIINRHTSLSRLQLAKHYTDQHNGCTSTDISNPSVKTAWKFSRILAWETLLGISVLFCVALLAHEAPPR